MKPFSLLLLNTERQSRSELSSCKFASLLSPFSKNSSSTDSIKMEVYEFPSEPHLSDKQVEDDVSKIHKACKGFGCDKKALIEVFGNRTSHQTSQIVKAYKAAHGEALIDLIKKETSGNLEGLLKSLIHTNLVLDCDQIHHSFGVSNHDHISSLTCFRHSV